MNLSRKGSKNGMGSFINVVGEFDIPEEKLQEFENSVLHVMDVGGMMRFVPVKIYGKSIFLLKKASEPDDDYGSYWACFNYFEDDRWEDMGYNPKKKYVYSNKLGWSVFNRVTGICHMLEELYSGGQCYVGGDLYVDPADMVNWINNEFGTDFNLNHRLDIFNVYKALTCDYSEPDIGNIEDYSIFFAKLIVYTDSSFKKLQEYLLSKKTEEETEQILNGLDKDFVIEDSRAIEAIAKILKFEKDEGRHNPSTLSLLGCDSNDDRLYWWTDGAFELSPDCQAWLTGIKEKHQQIMDSIHTTGQTGDNILKNLMDLLEHINGVYGHMFMFNESFYDFLEQKNTIEVRAAIKLLEVICSQGEVEIKVLKGDDGERNFWKIKRSKPRMEMKRFIALLGNRELRKKTLDF